MLEKVKKALRISSVEFDSELLDLIAACELDLAISGVLNYEADDALVAQAIILYTKANFGLDNQDSERYLKFYSLLKNHMASTGRYRFVE